MKIRAYSIAPTCMPESDCRFLNDRWIVTSSIAKSIPLVKCSTNSSSSTARKPIHGIVLAAYQSQPTCPWREARSASLTFCQPSSWAAPQSSSGSRHRLLDLAQTRPASATWLAGACVVLRLIVDQDSQRNHESIRTPGINLSILARNQLSRLVSYHFGIGTLIRPRNEGLASLYIALSLASATDSGSSAS
jgi:hypothetical protein